jgi:hypothetical protein
MSGDSDKVVTQTQTNNATAEPWEAAQPHIKQAMGDAQSLYESGIGFQPYTGSTVVPFSDQTMAAATDIEGRSAQDIVNNPFMGGFQNLSNISGGNGLSAYQQMVGDQWSNVAGGSDMYGNNPYFQKYLNDTLDRTGTQVDQMAGGLGRYGSGKHTDVKANTIGELANRMNMQEYHTQLGRMDNARSSLANLGQQGVANIFGANQMMPAAYDATFSPHKNLMNVGSMWEDLAARTMADNQRIFAATQQAPKDAIEWMMAIGSGAGSLGGQTTGTAEVLSPKPNPFMSVLGAGLGIADMIF